MKKMHITCLLLGCLFTTVYPVLLQAQFFKTIINTAKQAAQNRANQKASDATNKAIDEIDPATRKKNHATDSTSGKVNTATQTTYKSGDTTIPKPANTSSTGEDNSGTGEGYVSLKLSANKILKGGTVMISGVSVMYGELKEVTVSISGPSVNESKKTSLKTDGSFTTTWLAPDVGNYKITVKSSDGKANKSASVDVYKFMEMDQITGSNINETIAARDNILKAAERVKSNMTEEDVAKVKKKVNDITEKTNRILKFFNDLNVAGKGLDGIEKKYGAIPSAALDNLSKLANVLSEQSDEMLQLNTIAKHEPSDNTICEYLVMANEACAAFSTFTNFYAKCPGILINLATDKAVPAATGAANNAAGVSDGENAATKETAKLFAASKLDADWGESVITPLGKAGLAGDLAQMCTDVLLKKYCVVMSGNLKEDYKCTFRNADNVVWWEYTYTTQAAVSLRCPRNNSGGNVIRMKGNIEGNATKFAIYQKASEIDEFKKAMKDRAKLYSLLLYAPPSIPFASSKADKNVGFGAIARAIVTPAYFNIPFDADYDVAAKKIKMHLNTPIMDFNPSLTSYVYAYLTFPLGIPLVTRVNYPINNVKLTLGKVIEKNNDFDIKTDESNNLFFNKNASFRIGDKASAIEHNINFSLSAKND